MATQILPSEAFQKKYKDLLTKENSYSFLMKLQNEMRKISKKQKMNEFFELVLYGMKHLNSFGEAESCVSLLNLAFSQFTQNYKPYDDIEGFLKNFFDIYNLVPLEGDKLVFQNDFMKYCESQKISFYLIKKYQFYQSFAKDLMKKNKKIQAYSFAVKSEDFDTIDSLLTDIMSAEVISQKEKEFIVTRLIFQIILAKNLKLAYKIISKYIKKDNNFNNNPPVLNFAFLLVNLLTRSIHDFDNFWALINIYKGVIEEEYYYQFYLNKISVLYFNKPFLIDDSPKDFSIFSLLKNIRNK